MAEHDDEIIAWTAIKPGHKVLDSEGGDIGSVHRVLADEGAGIFHGVSVRRGLLGPEVEITADRIERITPSHVHASIRPEEAQELPPARGA